MQTETEVEVLPTGSDDDDDELNHLFCCDPNLALCGQDITDHHFISIDAPAAPEDCMVCEDLSKLPCLECGYAG